jgi:hypothetical protein
LLVLLAPGVGLLVFMIGARQRRRQQEQDAAAIKAAMPEAASSPPQVLSPPTQHQTRGEHLFQVISESDAPSGAAAAPEEGIFGIFARTATVAH